MRPVRLTMQAFGSYGKQTVIDFETANQNLFLVTGDTGAGKTTIFDAIVFALYGEASSGANKKDGTELQSQFADYSVQPFVELVFTEGRAEDRQEYSVRRIPRHFRPLRRGKGVKEESESVSLLMPDGNEYPPKETDRKLEEIVGLTKSQFMQVAMIAQGEFMELLRAKSDDKKVIFRRLFHTGLYQKIVEELALRRKSLQQEIARIRTACQTEAAHIVIPDEAYVSEAQDGGAAEQDLDRAAKQDPEQIPDRDAKQDPEQIPDRAAKQDPEQIPDRDAKQNPEQIPDRDAKQSMEHADQGAKTAAPYSRADADRLADWKSRVVFADRLSVTDLESLLEELKKLRDFQKLRAERLAKEYGEANDAYLKKRDACTNAQQLLCRFEELAQAQEEQKECERLELEMRAAKLQMTQIQAAYDIQAVYARYADARDAAKNTEKNLATLQEKLPGLEADSGRLTQEEQAAAGLREQEEQAYTRVAERVRKSLEVFAGIRAAEGQVKEAKEALQKAEQASENARKKMAGLEANEKAWREAEEEWKEAGVLLERWQTKREKAEEVAQELSAARSLQSEAVRQQQKAEKALGAYGRATEAYEKKKEAYETARRTFLNMQAGFLARELVPGKPCPVCGSVEHPSPCHLSQEHRELSREAVETLGKEADLLREAQEKAAAASKTAQAVLEEKKAGFAAALEKLRQRVRGGSAAVLSLEQIGERLFSWQRSLETEGERLQKQAEALAELRQRLQGLAAQKEQAKLEAEQTVRSQSAAQSALAAARAFLHSLEAARDFREEAVARQALEEAEQKRDAARQKAKQALAASRQARDSLEQTRALMERDRRELPAQEELCMRRKAEYEKAMEERRLSETQWQQITEAYDRSHPAVLQEKLQAHSQKKAAAKSRSAQALAAIGEQPRPDLAACRRAEEEARQRAEVLQQALERVSADFRENDRVLKALAPRMEERAGILSRHKKLDELYSVLSGNVSGARMDIETYVQRYYLQRILHAANRRFYEMSAGQFELRMRDIETAGTGKNRGLDLMVYSNVTGKIREVRTLSGGESFMAALALALGMADQIQQSVSSVNLDVMFIDEGFGSLDEHARDKAVRVLQDMAGGSKLIGIISHVTELKQEIENQLIVRRDETGSHVRWQIS